MTMCRVADSRSRSFADVDYIQFSNWYGVVILWLTLIGALSVDLVNARDHFFHSSHVTRLRASINDSETVVVNKQFEIEYEEAIFHSLHTMQRAKAWSIVPEVSFFSYKKPFPKRLAKANQIRRKKDTRNKTANHFSPITCRCPAARRRWPSAAVRTRA